MEQANLIKCFGYETKSVKFVRISGFVDYSGYFNGN